jgi:hypothetical protein
VIIKVKKTLISLTYKQDQFWSACLYRKDWKCFPDKGIVSENKRAIKANAVSIFDCLYRRCICMSHQLKNNVAIFSSYFSYGLRMEFSSSIYLQLINNSWAN